MLFRDLRVSFLKAGYALKLISQEIRAYIRRKDGYEREDESYLRFSNTGSEMS
jgi:hypothetical protein